MPLSTFDRILPELGLTFDDVMLVPAASNLAIKDTQLKTRFSQNIALNIPFVSSPHNAITQTKLAIAMAQIGGIGVLHKSISISEQADKVSKVKKFQARITRNVMTVTPETSVLEALEMQQRYELHVLPVVEAQTRVLIGIVTAENIKAVEDVMQSVGNFMMRIGFVTIASDVPLDDAYKILKEKNAKQGIVIDAQNRCVGLISLADKEKFEKNPLATLDEHGRLAVAAAIGTETKDYDRVGALIDAGVDAIYVDAINGHSKAVLDMVTHIRRQRVGHVDVIAGNVVTGDGARSLMDAGANAVRVGIHHTETGIGVPQLTATLAVVDACSIQNIPVLIDGGLNQPSDTLKALAAGASALMSGHFIADNDTSPQDALKPLLETLRTGLVLTGNASIGDLHRNARLIRISR